MKSMLSVALLGTIAHGCTDLGGGSDLGVAARDIARANPPRAADAQLASQFADEDGGAAGSGATAAVGGEDAPGRVDAASPWRSDEPRSDDSMRCGDGVFDADEYCDVAIPHGEPGACPTECEPVPGCEAPKLVLRACFTFCDTRPTACP